jgi:opacity protein-like surface antigen
MRKILLISSCIVLFSLGTLAQKGEAYFGFSDLTAGKNGWNGDLGVNVGYPVVVEGDFGGYYSHGEDIHSFMGGVKFQSHYRTRGFNPWGRFLFGGSHAHELNGASDNARSWALGGGLDANVYHNLGVRLTADAFHTRFFDSGTLRLRTGIGVVYHF